MGAKFLKSHPEAITGYRSKEAKPETDHIGHVVKRNALRFRLIGTGCKTGDDDKTAACEFRS